MKKLFRKLFKKKCEKEEEEVKSDFDKAITFTLKWEGGYVNHPDDPGGETKYGISKRAFPHLNIKNLTLADAKHIYKLKYWDTNHCNELPFPLNIVHFDACVNHGSNRANKFLQRATGFPEDGTFNQGILPKSKLNTQESAKRYLKARQSFYDKLTKSKKFAAFKNGWNNRMKDLEIYLGELNA